MKEWTREERYRTILDASNEEITKLKEIVAVSYTHLRAHET